MKRKPPVKKKSDFQTGYRAGYRDAESLARVQNLRVWAVEQAARVGNSVDAIDLAAQFFAFASGKKK